MQARVEAGFARELVEVDAAILGLGGPSDLVREGLRMVHIRAREVAMAESYDEFYGGQAAPVPEGAASIWGPQALDPLRGEVWEVRFPQPAGTHPVVVLTINTMIRKLSAVTVAMVSGTEGPDTTHVPLDAGAGLTGYEVSYANATDLHTLPKGKLRNRRGRLNAAELERLEGAVRVYLGL